MANTNFFDDETRAHIMRVKGTFSIQDQEYISSFTPLLEELRAYRISPEVFKQIQRITESIRPFIDAIEKIQKPFLDLAEKAFRVTRPYFAMKRLGEAQFVFWESMTEDFIEGLISTDNTDTVLECYEKQDNYQKSNKIIEACHIHPFIAPNKDLFKQTIEAYNGGHYNLAVLGFFVIIDNMLSTVSNNTTSKNSIRYQAILDKVENHVPFNNDDYVVITLYFTFKHTADTFYCSSQFGEDSEPSLLNRHWVAHGRSEKEYTRLDCIKLIYFLYGILLLGKIANE